MAHRNRHLSKDGNFERELNVTRAGEVVSEAVVGGVVRGGGGGASGWMKCLDESRSYGLVPALHLLSLKKLIRVQEVTGKEIVRKS